MTIIQLRRRMTGGLDAAVRTRIESAAAAFCVTRGRPLTAEEIVEQATAIRGKRIALAYADLNLTGRGGRVTGNLLGTPEKKIVVVDRRTARDKVIAAQAAAHELWHDWGEHDLLNLPVEDAELLEQFPDCDPRLVLHLGARCTLTASDPYERECEYFGAVLLERAMPSAARPDTVSGLPGWAASVLA